MLQETLQRERVTTGPAPFSDEFATTETRTGRVNVIHGVYAHTLPLAGRTIREARQELEDRMNIAPEAVALACRQMFRVRFMVPLTCSSAASSRWPCR